jgi:hypothetical protein
MIKADDPIVAEVRKARESLFAKYNHDLDAMVADLQRRASQSREGGRRVVSFSPRRPANWKEPTKKAG